MTVAGPFVCIPLAPVASGKSVIERGEMLSRLPEKGCRRMCHASGVWSTKANVRVVDDQRVVDDYYLHQGATHEVW